LFYSSFFEIIHVLSSFDFEVLATSAIAEKILGIFCFLVLIFGCLCWNLFVSSKFMATCVIEKDTERLDGFAFTTSQKLFNFSFPQLNKYEFLFYCFFRCFIAVVTKGRRLFIEEFILFLNVPSQELKVLLRKCLLLIRKTKKILIKGNN
jgi:hypothetical protein